MARLSVAPPYAPGYGREMRASSFPSCWLIAAAILKGCAVRQPLPPTPVKSPQAETAEYLNDVRGICAQAMRSPPSPAPKDEDEGGKDVALALLSIPLWVGASALAGATGGSTAGASWFDPTARPSDAQEAPPGEAARPPADPDIALVQRFAAIAARADAAWAVYQASPTEANRAAALTAIADAQAFCLGLG